MGKGWLKKTWDFIWHSNSVLSWIVNVILAFVIVKFLIMPGLGLAFDTEFPVVVVMSGSMEHDTEEYCLPNGQCFDNYICGENLIEDESLSLDRFWEVCGKVYTEYNITKEEFSEFRFDGGFDKGDLMFIIGKDSYEVGDVLVFQGSRSDPIIHRLVLVEEGYTTRGDHNNGIRSDEVNISSDRIFGKAYFRIPYVGWLKIGVMKLFGMDV